MYFIIFFFQFHNIDMVKKEGKKNSFVRRQKAILHKYIKAICNNMDECNQIFFRRIPLEFYPIG